MLDFSGREATVSRGRGVSRADHPIHSGMAETETGAVQDVREADADADASRPASSFNRVSHARVEEAGTPVDRGRETNNEARKGV